MDTPSFIHKKEEYLNRVAKTNTDIRLLARHNSLEVMKHKISEGSSFYLDSGEEWQGFEFIYLLEGKMEYTNVEPPITLETGDYISREGVPEESWFETKTEVTVLYTSTQPAFYMLRQEIEDYLQLAEEIESTERMDGHSKRLVRMSQKVGEILGLSADRLSNLRYASFFHDLGKARVPDRILEKEGKLTPDEWEIMEKHTIWGREMLEETEHLGGVGEIVEQSHERMDGKGYPKGLDGEEISLEARIIAVVDAWDAMRSDRPYRNALPREEAVAELRYNKGSQFDPEVVDVFLDVLEDRQISTSTFEKRRKYRGEPTWLRQREKLLELSRRVLEPENTDVIMAKTLEAVIEATPFQRALISVFDRPIDLENPEPARVDTCAYQGLTEEQEDRIEGGKMEGTQVNLDKFDPRYQLGNSFYVPHEERLKNLESLSVIESQLREEETLDWHPDDSLYIPLYKDNTIIGQISVDDPDDGLVPDPESLRPIESFASLASVGIEKNSRIEELNEQKHKLESLRELSKGLRHQCDVEGFCSPISEWAQDIFEFEKGIIFLCQGDQFVPRCTFPPELMEEVKPRLREGTIEEKAVQEGRPIWGSIDNIASNHPCREEGESILILPLGKEGNIQLISEYKGSFEEEDMTYLQMFVDRVDEEIERKKLEGELSSEKELLGSIMTQTPDLVYFKDDQQRFERVNDGYTDLLDLDEGEMLGKTAEGFWPEAEEIMEDERSALSGKPVIGKERKVTLPNGEKHWYSITKLPRRDDDGNIIGFLGIDRDITERKQVQKALDEERDKLHQLHDAVDVLQHQNTQEDVTQTAVEVAENILEFDICVIALLEGDHLIPKAYSGGLDVEVTSTKFDVGEGLAGKTLQKGNTILANDVQNHPGAQPTSDDFRSCISAPVGDLGIFQVISSQLGSFDERDVKLVEILAGHLSEELSRVRLEEELREQAVKDPLTDLYNRRYFNETLEKEVDRSQRYDKPIAFLMMDVTGSRR